MKTPTPPHVLAIIGQMYKDIEEPINHLHFRWQCEREHECFEDYQEVIRKLLPPEITMLKMTQRPFGFKFRVKGFDQALYEVKLTTRTYGWSRIK